MTKIRTLVVDDEPVARERIIGLLNQEKDIEVVGEYADGTQAVSAIQQLGPEQVPAVVFVTAYDEYALKAFEVHAIDYLLKPFDRERFDQALERALRQIRADQNGALNERILSLLTERQPQTSYLERFIIKGDGRVFFLKADEIEWIEAEGNYVVLHARARKHFFREAISNLEPVLDPRRFQRIGRSAIVNLDCIRELQPWSRGDYKVILHNGTELKLSHRFRDNLNKYLGGSL